MMDDKDLGLRIWAEFSASRADPPSWIRKFGSFPVSTQLCARDGGTFACHVKEKVKKGTYSLYSLALEKADIGVVMALRDTSEPVVWDLAGKIIIDSSVGTLLPGASFKEIRAMEDNDDFADIIDDAIFGSDADEAILMTPENRPFAVFMLGDDGTYKVLKGMDSEGAICALAIIQY
jgi:hypothetical protein